MKDAIIVLGCGVKENKDLPDNAKQRVNSAIELLDKKTKLIFCGKYSFLAKKIPKIAEAKAMKNYAISKGIASSTIICENKSKDTIGNAYFVRLILKDKNMFQITVVTSDYHMRRTKYIFNKILGDEFIIEYVSSKRKVKVKITN